MRWRHSCCCASLALTYNPCSASSPHAANSNGVVAHCLLLGVRGVCCRGPTLETGLLAWYCFDPVTEEDGSVTPASARDCSSHGRDGTVVGGVTFVEGGGYSRSTGSGYTGQAAAFDGSGSVWAPAFENFVWGTEMSVSVWINRGCLTQACEGADRTGCDSNYAGIVSNGYYDHASWEIRMGREDSCTMIGGGVITASDAGAWDHVGLSVSISEWHHIAMIYDGEQLHFYIDGVQASAAGDTGPIVTRDTDLVIGKSGEGSDHEWCATAPPSLSCLTAIQEDACRLPTLFGRKSTLTDRASVWRFPCRFNGMIDDVRVYGRVLSHDEVMSLYHH